MTKRLVVFVLLTSFSTLYCRASGPVITQAERDKVISSVEVYIGELSNKYPPVVVEKREEYKKKYPYGVWVDDNTFRVSAEGIPDEKLRSPGSMRKSARLAAEKLAANIILNIITDIQFELALEEGGMIDYPSIGLALKNEWLPFINKEGIALKEYFDEKQNCRIIYEINCRTKKRFIFNGKPVGPLCGSKNSLKSLMYWDSKNIK